MNFRRGVRRREVADLNVTSMVDVLLILLIFFVLTTTFSRQSGLKITLPGARGEATDLTQMVEIAIDAVGGVAVNGVPVSGAGPRSLRDALDGAAHGRLELPVLIRADRATPHQYVIHALDVAGRSGFRRVTFVVERAEEAP